MIRRGRNDCAVIQCDIKQPVSAVTHGGSNLLHTKGRQHFVPYTQPFYRYVATGRSYQRPGYKAMRMIVLINNPILLLFVAIAPHHGGFEVSATGVYQERGVTIHLLHQVVIDGIDTCGNVVGLRRYDLEPFRPDDVYRTAFVGLRPLHPRRVRHNQDWRTTEAFIEQRTQHSANEALYPHVKRNTLIKDQRPPPGIQLPNHRRRRQPQVHTNDDRTSAINDRA